MAAPPQVTTRTISGKFVLNKSLSDSPDEILRLQGVSWFKRRAASLFILSLGVKHTTDDTGVEHVDIDQILCGIPAMCENRILDGHAHDQNHIFFGPMTTQSCRMPVDEITDKFLKKDWAQDCIHDGIVLTESWSTPGKSSYTWKNVEAWGFAMVNGERRYVTRVMFTSPEKQDGPIYALFVYDYSGAI